MIVYHGSLVKVEQPRILVPSHTLDYGAGFYTTTSYDQAEKWVSKKLDDSHKHGFVNKYDWDERAIPDLNYKHFPEPYEEWIDFVHNNRTVFGFEHDFDVIYGPVANDKVYAAFALYEQGFIDKQALIREMRAYKFVDQLLFHTEKAIKTLTYIESKEVTR